MKTKSFNYNIITTNGQRLNYTSKDEFVINGESNNLSQSECLIVFILASMIKRCSSEKKKKYPGNVMRRTLNVVKEEM